MSIALSGLTASAKKADAAASNIANLASSGALKTQNGPAAYQTQITVQESVSGGGVSSSLTTKSPGFVPTYDPNSPFADENGFIGVPNTDLAEEIINLKLAETTYRANLKTLEASKNLSNELLRLFDEDA
jgi:flagellar basal-body rod protein FlgC